MRLFYKLALLCLLPWRAEALLATTSEHQQALKVKEAIFHRRYDEAQRITRAMNLPKTSPLPTLVNMTIIQLKMSENLTFTMGNDFMIEAEANRRVCEPVVRDGHDDVWNLMLCGAADSMRALYYVKSNQTLKALNSATQALRTFAKVKEKDPDNLDVELADAVYHFFKSEFTETKLSFLPFFKDRRGESIAKIQRISNEGVFARDLADFALALIAIEAGRKDIGHRAFAKLTGSFPESVLFKVMHAAFLIKVDDYRGAIAALDKLLRTAPEITASKYFMGRALALEGQSLDEAKKWLNEYLVTGPDVSVKGPSHYLLGLIAEKQGNLEEALKQYKAAYDIYPKYKASLKAILRLRNAQKT